MPGVLIISPGVLIQSVQVRVLLNSLIPKNFYLTISKPSCKLIGEDQIQHQTIGKEKTYEQILLLRCFLQEVPRKHAEQLELPLQNQYIFLIIFYHTFSISVYEIKIQCF